MIGRRRVNKMNKINCNHDISTPNHTVKFLNRRFLVYPDKICGVCAVCKKKLTFIKEENHYVLKEGQDNENV